MKTILITIALILIVLGLLAQGQLEMGVADSTLKVFPIDTIMKSDDEGDVWEHYYVDVDDNEKWDLDIFMSTTASKYSYFCTITVDSQDSTYIISDTIQRQFIGYCDDIYWDTVILTCPIKYDSGDIFTGHGWMAKETYLTKIAFYQEPCYYHEYIHHWVEEKDNYLGFVKLTEEKTLLGWLKVVLPHNWEIQISEYAIQDVTLNVPEILSGPSKILQVEYYDLYGRKINKPKKGFYIERKVTDKGIISTKHHIQ